MVGVGRGVDGVREIVEDLRRARVARVVIDELLLATPDEREFVRWVIGRDHLALIVDLQSVEVRRVELREQAGDDARIDVVVRLPFHFDERLTVILDRAVSIESDRVCGAHAITERPLESDRDTRIRRGWRRARVDDCHRRRGVGRDCGVFGR